MHKLLTTWVCLPITLIWHMAYMEKLFPRTFGYSRKKQTGALRIWNFQGYWKNNKWILHWFIKNNLEFQEVIKTKSCGISKGLGFRP